MVHIANPIYDAVFKYLMKNERVAKTLLSALLKKAGMQSCMISQITNLSIDEIDAL